LPQLSFSEDAFPSVIRKIISSLQLTVQSTFRIKLYVVKEASPNSYRSVSTRQDRGKCPIFMQD